MEYTKVVLDELTATYGSPLYVFDESGFIENYKELESAMKSLYSNYQIAYSYKTNYTPYICKIVKDLGAYAEVVSGMEYSIARRVGYDNHNIIFNGPAKGKEGKEAFLHGCILNVDSLDELYELIAIAKDHPERTFQIGLRINLDVGQGFISRFGIWGADIPKAKQRITETKNLKIIGLHCHISRARGIDAWKCRTTQMLSLVDLYFPEGLKFIDLGSGMFGKMAPELADQFSSIPSYQEYAAVTAAIVSDHFENKYKPILFTEPGTTLINKYISCVARIEAIKNINGNYFAILDCGIHTLGETCTLKKLPIRVIFSGEKQSFFTSMTFTGYTCLEQDIMYSGYSGFLAKDDYIVFDNVGGYSNVMKPPFIRPNCAMIVAKPNGTYQLIKSAESYEDLLRTYKF